MTERDVKLTKLTKPRQIRHELFALDPIAKELHARSCAERGVEPQWSGRRTNRAYYRRRARATEAGRRALESSHGK